MTFDEDANNRLLYGELFDVVPPYPIPTNEWGIAAWSNEFQGPPPPPPPPLYGPPPPPIYGPPPPPENSTYNGPDTAGTGRITADDVISLGNDALYDAIADYQDATRAEETVVETAPSRGEGASDDTADASVAFASAEDVADIAVDVDVF